MTKHLATIQIDTAPDTSASVIWMHGLGADASDFASMPQQLDLDGCPGIRFIFPNAPTMPVTINNGYVMRAWYDILGTDIVRREDEAGLRASQRLIEDLIAGERARGIAADHIVLAGFSQGCAMALQTGLRYPEKLAGLMCLSGYVPLNTAVAAERSAANQDTPIFMVHGRSDPVIPIQRAIDSRNLLQGLDYKIEWHDYAMPHSVCPEEVEHIGVWLRGIFA
ncbi:MAG TPA: alpha/beta hydrolase [Burkholderiaceae bacterium]|jgi:phospholipase/carboxylesterase